MSNTLPSLQIVFIVTTLATLILFGWVLYNSTSNKTKKVTFYILAALVFWLGFQFYITRLGIYSNDTASLPPKIALLGIFPCFFLIIILLLTKWGKSFIDSLPLKQITYLNIIRVPVEFVLFFLAANELIPIQMSFEGWNFDILAGITAPIIAYYGLVKGKINHKWILIWNIISLILLFAIIVISTLSAPSPFQQIPFEASRGFGIFLFPYSWLPTFIVPIVIFGHAVSIRQLIFKRN